VSLGASVLSDMVAPVGQTGSSPEMIMKHSQVQRVVSLLSPVNLYTEATSTILNPMRQTTKLVFVGPMEQLSMSRFQNPLPLLQSLLIVLPHLISLVAITVLCFGICYYIFMRQEIRSV
jgi:ABC-2 type transport system permease protein